MDAVLVKWNKEILSEAAPWPSGTWIPLFVEGGKPTTIRPSPLTWPSWPTALHSKQAVICKDLPSLRVHSVKVNVPGGN